MAVRAANIGPKGRRRRALMGVATLAVGVVALVVSLMSGVDRAWRVALVVPFWAGALGLARRALTPESRSRRAGGAIWTAARSPWRTPGWSRNSSGRRTRSTWSPCSWGLA